MNPGEHVLTLTPIFAVFFVRSTLLFVIAEPVNILVACGPYTPSDSLTFDPLLDLIHVITRDGPDVCILVQLLSIQSSHFVLFQSKY